MAEALILNKTLPCDGEYFPSPNKKYRETIVLVHHFGGSVYSLKRHQQFYNDLGYDCVGFNLSFQNIHTLNTWPLTADFKFGPRAVWVEEIERVLNAVAGPKIVASFSFPSVSAAQAIARRWSADIRGWITEGGPFLQVWRCYWNYVGIEKHIQNPVLRASLATLSYEILRGATVENDLEQALEHMPNGFPILSIRGWQDPLVPLSAMEAAFQESYKTKVQTLSLPNAGHIDGLKKDPEEYKATVESFLKAIAQHV